MTLTKSKRQLGLALLAATVAPALLAAACSGDDDATATATSTVAASASATTTSQTSASETPATGSATASVTASATAATAQPTTPSPVEATADTAGFFLYVARDGDTIDSISRAFNGEPGTAKAGFPDQIMQINQLTSSSVAAGQVLVIPLIRTGTDLIPGAGIVMAANAAGSAGAVQVLEPGPTTMSTYEGKIALHKVEIASSPNRGYRMEYWLTDLPVLAADGSFNQAAKVVKPLLVISTGFPPATGTDSANVAKDGNTYTVTTLEGATSSAAALAGDLIAAKTGP